MREPIISLLAIRTFDISCCVHMLCKARRIWFTRAQENGNIQGIKLERITGGKYEICVYIHMYSYIYSRGVHAYRHIRGTRGRHRHYVKGNLLSFFCRNRDNRGSRKEENGRLSRKKESRNKNSSTFFSPPPPSRPPPPLPAISRSLIARVEAPWKSASARGAIKIFKSKRARSLAGEAFLARSYPPRFSSSPVFPSHFPRHFPRGVRKVDFHFISKRILRDLA